VTEVEPSDTYTKAGKLRKKQGRPHKIHVLQPSARPDPAMGQFRCRKCDLRFDSVMYIDRTLPPAEQVLVDLAADEPAPPAEPEPNVEIPAGVFGKRDEATE
jgi:hypothetical protein